MCMVLSECLETKAESDLSGINELKKQVAELKSQLAALMKQRKPTAPKKEQPKKPETKKKKPDQAKPDSKQSPPDIFSSKPKPWYCFHCGEDGHIVTTCENDPKPALVAAKRKELRVQQQLWESQNNGTTSLN